MNKKLHISLAISNLLMAEPLSLNLRMDNLYAKFIKIPEICKQFSENFVNEFGNIPHRGRVPNFSDLKVVICLQAARMQCKHSQPYIKEAVQESQEVHGWIM